MAVDEVLTQLFRDATVGLNGITEKRMMGGICFLLNGNMLGGADRKKTGEGRFMFRVGKEGEAEALSRKGAIIMEQGGRRMSGMIFVAEKECEATALREWVSLAVRFVGDLPAK